tara:strand:- start:872 stop:1423 length:552 start_codon:yes stop_codon:yes gene_type:complete
MQYIEQSHKDLRLYLLHGVIPKNQFNLISESKFTENVTKVEFGILAESHFVTIQTPKYTFSEVCACTDTIIDGSDQFLLTELGDARKSVVNQELSYSFTYKVTNFTVGEVRLASLRSKRPHPHCYYLEHIFPTSIPGEESPVTEVYVTVGEQILIESVHTYPNNEAMVFTISTIEKANIEGEN